MHLHQPCGDDPENPPGGGPPGQVPGYQDYHDTPVPGDMSWDEGEEETQGGPSGPGPDGPPDGAAIPIDVDGDDGGILQDRGPFRLEAVLQDRDQGSGLRLKTLSVSRCNQHFRQNQSALCSKN